jgi:hypothetical protein
LIASVLASQSREKHLGVPSEQPTPDASVPVSPNFFDVPLEGVNWQK